jgi:HPt (histidine-containing phosphotransfer) domain-containing protein
MQVVEIDKELEDIFPVYLRNRQEDLMHLEASLDRQDFDIIKQIGHKVAGNAEGYGLDTLGQYARELEEKAKDRDFAACSELVAKMKSFLKEIQLKFV